VEDSHPKQQQQFQYSHNTSSKHTLTHYHNINCSFKTREIGVSYMNQYSSTRFSTSGKSLQSTCFCFFFLFNSVARKVIFFRLVFKLYSGFAKLMYNYYYYKMGETVNTLFTDDHVRLSRLDDSKVKQFSAAFDRFRIISDMSSTVIYTISTSITYSAFQ